MPKAKATKAVIRDEVFRVYRCDESTRDAMKDARLAAGMTTKDFIAAVIQKELADLAHSIVGLCIVPHRGPTRPCRLPLSDEIVAKLQEASRMTSVPGATLLMACIRRAAVGTSKTVKPATKPAARLARRKQARKAGRAAGAKEPKAAAKA